ncbi:inositol monophosphatase family protein [Nocardia sp. NPDC050413]|uniref:inositol monophosphatase family protein n=1 Tax=Nocardia sp. NPDC050413 TaxID=3155784 RepID=UPI0033F74CC4
MSILESKRVGSVSSKGDRDFVTDVDVAIQEHIRRFLAVEAPHIAFLGEEGDHQHHRLDETAFWALDPIDGTSNYIHGIPLFGISLALFENHEPAIGVISMPTLQREYYAASGMGAYRNGERIHIGTSSRLSKSIISIGDYAVGQDAAQRNRPRLSLTALLAARAERIRMFGSAAFDLACVADGSTDGCVILSNNPWDIAAGAVIVRESGGVVYDSDGSAHNSSSRHTIAGNDLTAKELVALVGQAHAEAG